MEKISSAAVSLRKCTRRLEELNVKHFKKNDEVKKDIEMKSEDALNTLHLAIFIIVSSIEGVEKVFKQYCKKGHLGK